jgi:hypothetical protein
MSNLQIFGFIAVLMFIGIINIYLSFGYEGEDDSMTYAPLNTMLAGIVSIMGALYLLYKFLTDSF